MNKIEKLATQYQEEVLPYVSHLETKERNSLLKNIEKGKHESLVEWKEVLTSKGVNADKVVESYLNYIKEVAELDEEDNKKLKNKNTYFIRKNTDVLKEKFENLTKVVSVKETVVKETVIKTDTTSSLLKTKKKVSVKQKAVNKNAKRVKKQRGKKRKSL